MWPRARRVALAFVLPSRMSRTSRRRCVRPVVAPASVRRGWDAADRINDKASSCEGVEARPVCERRCLEKDGRQITTLDLLGAPGNYVLLTGPSHDDWDRAAGVAKDTSGVTVTVTAIGPRNGLHDVDGTGSRVRGVQENGAVLVRPDQFVAWPTNAAPGDSTTALSEALRDEARRMKQMRPAGPLRGGDASSPTAGHMVGLQMIWTQHREVM